MASRAKPKPEKGIEVRHSRECISEAQRKAGVKPAERRCNCEPTYRAWVWSPDDDKKIQETFKGKGAFTAAKRWRKNAGSDVENGRLRAPRPTTLRDVSDAWLVKARAGLPITKNGRAYKPSVVRTYEGDLKRYILGELGDVRLDELKRRHVQAFVDGLVEREMPGASVRRILMPLRVLIRAAIQSDDLQANPMQYLALPAADGRRERAVFPVEAETLLAPLQYDDQALWACAIYGTLRRGELRGLRWNDVSADLSSITVRCGWDDKEGEVAPKSKAAHRTLPVFQPLRHRLLELQIRSGRRGNDLVFGRTASEPFTPTHVRNRALNAWVAAVVAAFLTGKPLPVELNPLGLHEGRHSAKSMMSAALIADGYIDLYMGHSTGGVSASYWHPSDDHLSDNAKRFDAYFARVTGEATSPTTIPQAAEKSRKAALEAAA